MTRGARSATTRGVRSIQLPLVLRAGPASRGQKPLRVLVVDDHPVVREGLIAMLSTDPGIDVVGEAGNGEEAIEKANQLDPDMVLTDIRMPGMSGIEVTRRIKAAHPGTAVIILTMYDSEMYVVEALRAGAAGYLVKDSSRELLCHAIHAVADGGTLVRSGLLRQAVQGLLHAPRRPDQGVVDAGVAGRFTPRELDVLRLVAQGHANKKIAGALNLAEVTVKKHVQTIIAKLGASDRTHAAIVAVRLGLAE
ncbi:MAG: response regulator transcription factor [Chloroflexi bacterium]|nr:response regulator transcription factor [Chloroflexota bacterium]